MTWKGLVVRWRTARRLWSLHGFVWGAVPLILHPDLLRRSRLARLVFASPVKRLSDGRVVLRLPDGSTMLLPACPELSEGEAGIGAWRLLWYDLYCLDQYDAHRFLRPGMTVIDGGAHVGCFARLASELVGPTGRVVAIEPCPQNVKLLQSNLRGQAAQMTVLARALGGADGTRTVDGATPTWATRWWPGLPTWSLPAGSRSPLCP